MAATKKRTRAVEKKKSGMGLLLDSPKPMLVNRKFYKARVNLWQGRISVNEVQGYAKNDRIEHKVERFKKTFSKEPNNEDLYRIMLEDPEMRIVEMAESIRRDGVKVPLVLGFDGELLDGNRRYFGTYHLLRQLEGAEHAAERAEISSLPAIVLTETYNDETRESIIVECNFVDETVPWSPHVKARRIHREFERLSDAGATKLAACEELAERFAETPSRIRNILDAYDLILDFQHYHDLTQLEDGESKDGRIGASAAEDVVGEAFVRFEESHNKLKADLQESEFRDFFLQAMARPKFVSSFKDVRDIKKIRESGRAAFQTLVADFTEKRPDAIEHALFVANKTRYEDTDDGSPDVAKVERRVIEFSVWLGKKVGVELLKKVSAQTVEALYSVSKIAGEALQGMKAGRKGKE